MNDVLNQATKKIANVIQKSISRTKGNSKGIFSSDDLDNLIKEWIEKYQVYKELYIFC